MSNLVYKSGDLFSSAPANAILAHACNCQGLWGAGIALKFKEYYPLAFKQYRDECLEHSETLWGRGRLYIGTQNSHYGVSWSKRKAGVYAIGCLFTSVGYGWNVDHPSNILEATTPAIEELIYFAKLQGLLEIHSPRFNSGHFRVPWTETEKKLLDVLRKHPEVKWTVWDL